LLAKTPLAREGTMLEIADTIDFLASDRASSSPAPTSSSMAGSRLRYVTETDRSATA